MAINGLRTGLCALVLGAAFVLPSGCATVRSVKDNVISFEKTSLHMNGMLIKGLASNIMPKGRSGEELITSGAATTLMAGAVYTVATGPAVMLGGYLVGLPAIIGTGIGVAEGLPEDVRNTLNTLGGVEVEKPFFPGIEDPTRLYD